MKKISTNLLLQKQMSRREFIGFSAVAGLSLFGILRVISELKSHASGTPIGFQPETGTITGPAKSIVDYTASASGALQFGPKPDGFVLGVTEPNATNTGVPDSKIFDQANIITSNVIITVDGTIIDGKEIQATVTVKAANVTIRNCRIIGPQTTAARVPLIYHIDDNVENFRLEHCTVRPTLTSDGTDTLMGHNITRVRNNISRGVDGSGSYIVPSQGSDVNYVVQGDYIHDLAYFCPSNTHSDNHSHNDGNQHHNGTNVTFEGCAIHGYWDPAVGDGNTPGTFSTDPSTGVTKCLSGNCNDNYGKTPILGRKNVNASFQVNQVSGGITDDLHLVNNWIYGGASSINIADLTLSISTFELRGNRFEVPLYGRNAIIIAHSESSAIIQASGNTYMDNGQPMLGTVGNGRINQT